jgi:hypothetical protein
MDARIVAVGGLAGALLVCGLLAANWPEPHIPATRLVKFTLDHSDLAGGMTGIGVRAGARKQQLMVAADKDASAR